MRWNEIVKGNALLEGVTFHPTVEKTTKTGETYYSWPDEFVTKRKFKCRDCDGTGKEYGSHCYGCNGTGEETEEIWNFPNLDVSNSNMEAILEMLGIEPHHNGVIKHDEIPELRRRLIYIKNKGVDAFTKEPSKERARIVDKDDAGNTRIRPGAEMNDLGRTDAQVMRYIDRLQEIFDFAYKNKMMVSWA